MNYILGIDEVGRGCLAGPVHLGGVMLLESFPLQTWQYDSTQDFSSFQDLSIVRDSKKLSAKKREIVSETIQDYKFPSLVLSASNLLIDEYGIGVCISHMLSLLVFKLLQNIDSTDFCKVLVDGQIKILSEFKLDLIDQLNYENSLNVDVSELTEYFKSTNSTRNKFNIVRENKADDKYLSVALASNLAKVTRDNFMKDLGQKYPVFDWQTNKGYGTAKHREVIKDNLDNEYLRQSFLGRVRDIT
jgi:ribonuclease HII